MPSVAYLGGVFKARYTRSAKRPIALVSELDDLKGDPMLRVGSPVAT